MNAKYFQGDFNQKNPDTSNFWRDLKNTKAGVATTSPEAKNPQKTVIKAEGDAVKQHGDAIKADGDAINFVGEAGKGKFMEAPLTYKGHLCE